MDDSRIDTQLTEWAEGDFSTQLIVDLNGVKINRKRDLESSYPPEEDPQDIPTEDELESESGKKRKRNPGKQKTRKNGSEKQKIINGNTFFIRCSTSYGYYKLSIKRSYSE